jgi:hypothetical protein
MAQMVQRTLVKGVPAGFGERGILSAVSGGQFDAFERPEEKLTNLFIASCDSFHV